MRRHLLVVSEKKIKMLKTIFLTIKSQVLQVAHFLRTNYAYMCNKYLHEIKLIIYNSLADTFRMMTKDVGHWMKDDCPPLPIL